MQTRRRYRHRSQGRSRHLNTPDAIRHRRALADAKREELAATLPPAPTGPEPLTLWQRIVVEVYVPTSGRCDQHATVIDGERVGLLSASRIGVKVREAIRKRPSVDYLAEARQQGWA